MKKVSVICIDCDSDYIDDRLGNQTYPNLEVVEAVTGKDFYQDIVEYCEYTDSEYICFLEDGQWMVPDKIKLMVEYADRLRDAAVLFCHRNYAEKDGTVVAYPDNKYRNVFKDTLFAGDQILYRCIDNGRNLLGNLTTTMFCREKAIPCMENLKRYAVNDNPTMQKAFLLFEILAGRVVGILEKTLVSTFVEPFRAEKFKCRQMQFEKQLQVFSQIHGWEEEPGIFPGIAKEHRGLVKEEKTESIKLKKEITFFATDDGEYYNLLPLMHEAKKRGYQVNHTDNMIAKAEIGVYCQHTGYPQNARFSVVLLHDMAQGANHWPNLWESEHWSDYDIGILPNEEWKERFERCSFHYYTCPRCGAYVLGYPKSSEVFSNELEERARELKESLGLAYDVSVLYAPSWENDGKEDEFVHALESLPVNLLVKQAMWAEDLMRLMVKEGYQNITENIHKMREMHEGKYKNLYYIEPEESIMTALKICDLIVSDESNVMIEGMMFGKPAIAVEDWLIPDVNPPRLPSVPYESIYKCKKAALRETVARVLSQSAASDELTRMSESLFPNKEHVNRDIMDAIEYFTVGGGRTEFRKESMSCRYMPVNMWS